MLEHVPAALAALLMPAAFAAHATYYRVGSRRSTKQDISVRDDSADTVSVLSIEGPDAGRIPPDGQVITLHLETIVSDDLHLSGRHHYKKAIKVTGDLVVEGHATFDHPVVVDGHVRVEGEAEFKGGLLAKGELVVTGHARFGTDAWGSWCIARRKVGKVITAPIQENLKQDIRIA